MPPEHVDDSALEGWPFPSREVLRQLEGGPVWPVEAKDNAPEELDLRRR